MENPWGRVSVSAPDHSLCVREVTLNTGRMTNGWVGRAGFLRRQFGRSGRRSSVGTHVIEPIGRGTKCEYLYIAYSYLPESIHYWGSTRQPSRQID